MTKENLMSSMVTGGLNVELLAMVVPGAARVHEEASDVRSFMRKNSRMLIGF